MSFDYVISGTGNISLIMDDISLIIPKEHVNYDVIVEALQNNDEDTLRNPSTLFVAKAMENFLGADFSIIDGELLYHGTPYHSQLGVEVLKHIKAGCEPGPMLRFLDKCDKNPSQSSIAQLFGWLKNVGLAIAEDGDILGFKRVLVKNDGTYTDIYSETTDCSIGKTVEMPREQVMDDPSVGCSTGLHVGTMKYVNGYCYTPTRTVIVKVNPADVVSVPTECEEQKLRCCRYTVLGDLDKDDDQCYNDEGFKEPVVHSSHWGE